MDEEGTDTSVVALLRLKKLDKSVLENAFALVIWCELVQQGSCEGGICYLPNPETALPNDVLRTVFHHYSGLKFGVRRLHGSAWVFVRNYLAVPSLPEHAIGVGISKTKLMQTVMQHTASKTTGWTPRCAHSVVQIHGRSVSPDYDGADLWQGQSWVIGDVIAHWPLDGEKEDESELCDVPFLTIVRPLNEDLVSPTFPPGLHLMAERLGISSFSFLGTRYRYKTENVVPKPQRSWWTQALAWTNGRTNRIWWDACTMCAWAIMLGITLSISKSECRR